MARIRTIKPEFPHSENIGQLSRDARLLFLQLFTLVDDTGRARAASRMLASLLYPYDDDAPKLIETWLQELEVHACIERYEAGSSQYLRVINWLKHQKIDHPTASRLPSPDDALAKPREASRSLAPDLGPRTLDQGSGKKKEVAANAAPPPRSRGTTIPENWAPNEGHFLLGETLEFSHVEILEMADDMVLWAKANSNRAVARKADWDATFTFWVRRQKRDRKPNGTTKSPIMAACDNIIEHFERRDRTEGENVVGLLPHRGRK